MTIQELEWSVTPEYRHYVFRMNALRNGLLGRVPPRHERLKAWVACHELVLAIYRITADWPAREQYGLTSQARRAAYSGAANIAEGSAKRGNREFRRYLNIALGSIAELSYVLLLAKDLRYLSPEIWGEVEALRDHAGRLTWGLYRSLESKPEPIRVQSHS